MKLKKLDMRGFSHDLALVAFVVVFAIAGVAYLVGSHADSCSPTSGPTSSPTSATVSGSCPTSGPVSAPGTLIGSCFITSMSQVQSRTAAIVPTVTVSNKGSQVFTPSLKSVLTATNTAGVKTVTTQSLVLTPLNPGQNVQHTLANVSVTSRSTYQITVSSTTPLFSCSTILRNTGPGPAI